MGRAIGHLRRQQGQNSGRQDATRGVTPGQFWGCFLGSSWYVSLNSVAQGPASYAALAALAADLDEKLDRKGVKLGSKPTTFLCLCPVFTGATGKASSGRLGF